MQLLVQPYRRQITDSCEFLPRVYVEAITTPRVNYNMRVITRGMPCLV